MSDRPARPINPENVAEQLLSRNTSLDEKAALIDDWVIKDPDIKNMFINALDDPEEHVRKEAANAVIDYRACLVLWRRWMLDERRSEMERIKLIHALREHFPRVDNNLEDNYDTAAKDDNSDFRDWEVLAKDRNPRISSAAKEYLLYESESYPQLFPFFMQSLLDHRAEPDWVESHLDLRWSGWNMTCIPSSDARDVWKEVDARSFALIAETLGRCGLARRPFVSRAGMTAAMILQAAPELPLDTVNLLLDLWEDLSQRDIVPIRKNVISIFSSKLVLPQKAISLLLSCLEKGSIIELASPPDGEDAVWLKVLPLEQCAQACARLMKHGHIEVETVVRILNDHQETWIVEFLLNELVSQHLDLGLVPLLNRKALTALFTVWFEQPQETELIFSQQSGGLLVHRDGSEIPINIEAEKINQFLELFAKIKLDIKAHPRKRYETTVVIPLGGFDRVEE